MKKLESLGVLLMLFGGLLIAGAAIALFSPILSFGLITYEYNFIGVITGIGLWGFIFGLVGLGLDGLSRALEQRNFRY